MTFTAKTVFAILAGVLALVVLLELGDLDAAKTLAVGLLCAVVAILVP